MLTWHNAIGHPALLRWHRLIGQLVTALLLHQIKLWCASKFWRHLQETPYHGAQTQGNENKELEKRKWVGATSKNSVLGQLCGQ